MLFFRNFHSSSKALAQFVARTTILPKSGASIQVPTSFTPKSVVLLSTPQNLPTVIENAIGFYQFANLQVLVAGVDAVAPNGARNGVSELWLDEYLEFSKSVNLKEKDKAAPLRESDGVHVVGAKTHWKQIDASLRLFLDEKRLDLSLANTAFSTNTLATLFFFQPKELQEKHKDPNMGETLCELTAKLPPLDLNEPSSHDRWTKLTEEELIVTKFTGNLVKQINHKSAASVLEQNKKLMSLASKDTKVYVKQIRDEISKKFEVIAGGGGWGAKADLLAILPEIELQLGDKLEFYMVSPEDRFSDMKSEDVHRKLRFECVPETTTYGGGEMPHREVEVFGCGCESGFKLDGLNHASPGEIVEFPY